MHYNWYLYWLSVQPVLIPDIITTLTANNIANLIISTYLVATYVLYSNSDYGTVTYVCTYVI